MEFYGKILEFWFWSYSQRCKAVGSREEGYGEQKRNCHKRAGKRLSRYFTWQWVNEMTLFRSVCGLIRDVFASHAAQYCKKWKRSQHKDICQLEECNRGAITTRSCHNPPSAERSHEQWQHFHSPPSLQVQLTTRGNETYLLQQIFI